MADEQTTEHRLKTWPERRHEMPSLVCGARTVSHAPEQITGRVPFNPRRQCCWCGGDNTSGPRGYAGERACPTCGWGGQGESDVPCMFYKIARAT